MDGMEWREPQDPRIGRQTPPRNAVGTMELTGVDQDLLNPGFSYVFFFLFRVFVAFGVGGCV